MTATQASIGTTALGSEPARGAGAEPTIEGRPGRPQVPTRVPGQGPSASERPLPLRAPLTTILRRPEGEQSSEDSSVAGSTSAAPSILAGAALFSAERGRDAGGWNLVRSALTLLAVCAFAFIGNLVVLSQVQHASTQYGLRDRIRAELAQGVAPAQAVDSDNHLLPDGSPVGILQIPDLGVDEVVLFGSTSRVLMDGVALRRDSVFPGQRGASVVMGRAAAYGGPFGDIARLARGTAITVTTGQGVQHFSVVTIRRAGDPLAPAPVSGSRLTLVTASGSAFMPSGLVRVDADLVGDAQPTPAVAITASQLRPAERAMAGDPSDIWYLVFALQGLLAAFVGAVVAWHRWGHLQAWVVFGPVILLAAWWVQDNVVVLLPNLL